MNRWTRLPKQMRALAAATQGAVLLETSRFDAKNQHSYLFLNPISTIVAQQFDDIADLFRRIELALSQGHHVAGYLSYECGYHFESFAESPLPQQIPLAWFGVYAQPYIFNHSQGSFEGPSPGLRAFLSTNLSPKLSQPTHSSPSRRTSTPRKFTASRTTSKPATPIR